MGTPVSCVAVEVPEGDGGDIELGFARVGVVGVAGQMGGAAGIDLDVAVGSPATVVTIVVPVG